MNTTFTKDENEEVVVPLNGEAKEIERNPAENSEYHLRHDRGGRGGPGSSSVESLCGCTRAEIIVLKHTAKLLTELIERLLSSDEFEVRRCATGQIISQGRCSNGPGGNSYGVGSGVSNEELIKVLKDRDNARQEADKLHANYAALFASFNTVREAANDIRMEYEDARDKLKMAVTEVDEWQQKFMAVKDNANSELERASMEYDELLRQHDENTKGLRLRVKRQEIDLASKNDEIRVLSSRVEELSAICDQLLNDVDVSDGMSVVSTDAP